MKMIDENTRKMLIAYLDGSLEREERAEVKALLKRSSACRKELGVLKKTLSVTKTDSVPFFKPIEWAIPSRRTSLWWRWVLAPAAVAVAAAGFIIFGGLNIFLSSPTYPWVVVGEDSLTYEEGYQLVNMMISTDSELKEGMVKYSETMSPDVYSELVDLEDREAEVLIFLLEEKIADLERS